MSGQTELRERWQSSQEGCPCRRALGLSEHIDTKLVLGALEMALEGRQPPQGLIHHSDRGSQYASAEYRQALASRSIQYSMSRKGNCRGNAMVESFFSSLKMELVHLTDFSTRQQARSEIFEYIEVFYNSITVSGGTRRWAT